MLRGDAPLAYRIAPNPIARPRARETGALLSPCHNPGVDEDHDDGTDVPMTILENLHGIASRPRGRT